MATIGRNINGRIAEIRDFFLSAEKDYLKELLKAPENKEKIKNYKKMPLDIIVSVCESIIKSMELGVIVTTEGEIKVIDEITSSRLEKQLVLLMASIDDYEIVKSTNDEVEEELER